MPEVAPRPVQNPAPEPVELPHRTSTGAGTTGSDSTTSQTNDRKEETKKEEQGGFNPIKLLTELPRDISDATKAVGDWSLAKLGMASKEMLMPTYDAATQTKVDKLVKGNQVATDHENLFLQIKGQYTQAPVETNPDAPRIRYNQDNSYNKLDDKGRISEFTTAPTKDQPKGVTYKNIQYDESGAMKSFETPWNTKITRVGEPNAEGYAKWQSTNMQGRPVPYQGSDSSSWYGKSVVDAQGFHTIVASGPKQWNMYSRLSDGTHVETHPQVQTKKPGTQGQLKGFETTITLSDNTKLETKTRFENHEPVRSKYVDMTEPDGTRSSLELNADKSSGRYISPEQRKMSEKLGSMIDFDKHQVLGRVNRLTLTTEGNNIYFDAKTDGAIPQPAAKGPFPAGRFGRSTAMPRSAELVNPHGTIVTDKNNPLDFKVENMGGFRGTGDGYGPLGRYRKTETSETRRLSMYTDSSGRATLRAESGSLTADVHKENLSQGPIGEALASPAKRKELTGQLAEIRDNLKSLEFVKNPKTGNLTGSFDPKISEIALNKKLDDPIAQKLGLEATNLYFKDGKLSFEVNKMANGKEIKFNNGDLQIGLRAGNGKEFQRMSISKVVITKDAEGRSHAELEFYGRDARARIF